MYAKGMSDNPTIWDHINEHKPSWLERQAILLRRFPRWLVATSVRFGAFYIEKKTVSLPLTLLFAGLVGFTWLFSSLEEKAKEEEKLAKAYIAELRKDYPKRALTHWNEYREAFLPVDLKYVCYHGDNLADWEKGRYVFYKVTCIHHVGTKEKAVTCNQKSCYEGKVPPPPPAADMDKEGVARAHLKEEMGGKAKKHWSEWDAKFVKPAGATAVCYHGDNISNYVRAKPYYRITCTVKNGKKTEEVVCDDKHCSKGKVEAKESEAKPEPKPGADLKSKLGSKARARWADWKENFVDADAKVSCVHGDNTSTYKWSKVQPFYKIVCHVKSDGPVEVFTCNSKHCVKGTT